MKFVLALSLAGLLAACASKNNSDSKTTSAGAANGQKLAWEINIGIENPESAYFDEESKTLFISNVAGTPVGHDGKGWITALTEEGQVQSQNWISGLDAPKGMRSHKGVLWISDINRVIAVEIKSRKILHKIKINSAKFLNDIAIDASGKVYISDTFGDRIFTITNGSEVGLFTQGEQLESPNGLYIKGNTLYVSAWGKGISPKDFSVKTPGNLMAFDLKTKKKTSITTKPLGNLDGLEMKDGSFLVSDWVAGKIYEVSPKGDSKILMEGFKNSADIGFIKGSNLLVVPNMGGNSVQAFKL